MKITIHTNADFTPVGKRVVRCVKTSRGGTQIRWYVGGRLYHRLAVNAANSDLSHEWLAA